MCIKLVKHGEKSSKTSQKKKLKCVACASTSRNFVPCKTRFAWRHGYTNATFKNSEYSLYKRSHQIALGVRPRNKSPPTYNCIQKLSKIQSVTKRHKVKKNQWIPLERPRQYIETFVFYPPTPIIEEEKKPSICYLGQLCSILWDYAFAVYVLQQRRDRVTQSMYWKSKYSCLRGKFRDIGEDWHLVLSLFLEQPCQQPLFQTMFPELPQPGCQSAQTRHLFLSLLKRWCKNSSWVDQRVRKRWNPLFKSNLIFFILPENEFRLFLSSRSFF